jgi:hypothetical protein
LSMILPENRLPLFGDHAGRLSMILPENRFPLFGDQAAAPVSKRDAGARIS